MVETLKRGAWFSTAVVAALLMLLALYGMAGMIGGAIPANRDWRAPDRGVSVWVESNGVHVGIVVPKRAGGVDWRGFASPRDLGDPRFAGYDHLAIGWGERDFFLGTPTWADVRLPTVLAAGYGSDATLLHVEHVPRPREGGDVRRVVLTPAEYRRLAAAIMASRGAGPARRGYAANDVFYPARGHYSAVTTCNAWVGWVLRFAGVRVGAWTPFPETVLWWF
ncbi:uncharacterized protein (TIGR02117 family) [Sphingomonas jinjuensis]|uniref:Uncharacterized protein (TIGR02117 family) n=1 Tax=Sphingomonas jinjuensis TaxID=535907 RepID=A0A840F7P8_9SPHN|nr:DUF2459 domain-containing protein [Sphingomonas jinjuensis]MBB4153749.1 uncharacterized protein (TIGR02117 family) [Sphingomonas jinjuensis]